MGTGPTSATNTGSKSGEAEQASKEGGEEDQAESVKSDRLPPRVPWRGTSLKWEHAVTAQTIGVGQDYQSSSGDIYQMAWALALNYFLVDQDDWRLQLTATPGFSVELTNSDWTTTEREPLADDLPLIATLGATLYKSADSAFVTAGSAALGVIFPTSPTSYHIGTYLNTQAKLGISQAFPLAGEKSPIFPSFAIGLSGRWDHRFGKAETAVSGDLQRPRTAGDNTTFLSDQLSFGVLADNTLREGISLSFPHQWSTVELDLFGSFSFAQAFRNSLPSNDCEVVLATGCVTAQRDPDARTSSNGEGFTVGLTFFPVPEAGLSIAYANSTGQLGPDGQRRDIFYSPDAMFVADIYLSIDAIYERLTGPAREGSYVLAQDNKRKERRSESVLSF